MISCLQKIQNIINIGTNLGLHTRRKKGKTWLVSCAKKQKMIEIGPDLARFEGEPEDAVEGTLSYTIYNDVHEYISQLSQSPHL